MYTAGRAPGSVTRSGVLQRSAASNQQFTQTMASCDGRRLQRVDAAQSGYGIEGLLRGR
jgi:hypothetical protein